MNDRAVGRGDQRAVPLEHDVDAMRRRRSRARCSSRFACTSSIDMPISRAISPGMRRDDHVDAVAAHQPLRLADERVQRIGIEHQRHAGTLDAAPGRRPPSPAPGRAPGRPRSRRPGYRAPARRRLKSMVPAGVSSSGSVMYSGAIAATIGTHDRGVATVTRPAPDRSAPIAARCAAPVLPERAGDDQHAAEVALVRIGGARRHQLAHPLARQQLEVRALELVDHRRRDADVGDHQVAGVRVGGRKHQRQSSARRASRSSTPRSPSPSSSCESAESPVGRSIATTGRRGR